MKKIWDNRITYIIIGWLLILAAAALDPSIAVRKYEISSDKVGNPVRIVLITDFHSTNYGEDQQTLTDVIRAQDPDVLMFAGDIGEEIRPHKNTQELLSVLSGEFPCFYVTGNHEEWSGEVEKIKELVRSCGVRVLQGESVILDVNGQDIRISGVENSMPGTQFEDCCSEAGDGIFTVLMSHRPDHVDFYTGRGFDLVVCGHAHGGQAVIPGFAKGERLVKDSEVTLLSSHGRDKGTAILNGLYAPDQGFFPKYAGGEYLLADGSTEMIVSRGLCRNVLPRVFDQPEVVVIDVIPENYA